MVPNSRVLRQQLKFSSVSALDLCVYPSVFLLRSHIRAYLFFNKYLLNLNNRNCENISYVFDIFLKLQSIYNTQIYTSFIQQKPFLLILYNEKEQHQIHSNCGRGGERGGEESSLVGYYLFPNLKQKPINCALKEGGTKRRKGRCRFMMWLWLLVCVCVWVGCVCCGRTCVLRMFEQTTIAISLYLSPSIPPPPK